MTNHVYLYDVPVVSYPHGLTVADKLDCYQYLLDDAMMECVRLSDDLCLVCDDEGLIKGLPVNRVIHVMHGSQERMTLEIHGPFFIVGTRGPEFVSISDRKMRKIHDAFTRRYYIDRNVYLDMEEISK